MNKSYLVIPLILLLFLSTQSTANEPHIKKPAIFDANIISCIVNKNKIEPYVARVELKVSENKIHRYDFFENGTGTITFEDGTTASLSTKDTATFFGYSEKLFKRDPSVHIKTTASLWTGTIGTYTVTAAVDIWLLDLIDQYAPLYFNPSWNLNINQFKAWLATIAWSEGGLGGYGAHSQYGGGFNGDAFNHIVAGASFRFSTGIGPFQLDRGSSEDWELLMTGEKIYPILAVESAARWHYDNMGSGSTLNDFSNISPWYGVQDPASYWSAVTGTSWSAHSGGIAALDWSVIKNQLASNATYYPYTSYSNNVVNLGYLTWNINSSENIFTESSRPIIFDGSYQTWLVTARSWSGNEVCKYYYTFRTDGAYPIEVWVWDNNWDTTNKFKYIFARECNGPFPEYRSGSSAGYPILSQPAIITEETLSVTLTADPSSGNSPLNGVDFTATISGTATGTINYTFYANRSDSGTNITPDYCFKIDGRNPDGTGGTVIYQGIATGWTGGITFTVYNVYNYTSPGTYTAKVIAERGSAPPAENRFTITVNAPPDTTPPTVTITSPTSNPTYSTSNSTINIGGTASDNIGVTQVTWSNDRGGSGTCSGTTSWSKSGITLYSGQNIITVTAWDAANNTGTDTLTVTYTPPDTTPPTVTITSPTSNPTYSTSNSTINIGGTASDNVGVTQVTWSNDRGGSGTCSGTTSWNANGITLYNGQNVITVTAWDAANNTVIDTITVTYTPSDITPPNVTITIPTSDPVYSTDSSPISIGGTASDNVGVTQVTWSNDRGGSGTCSGTTSWSANGITLYSGQNVITITAWDAANNTGTDILTIDYIQEPEPPEWHSPTETGTPYHDWHEPEKAYSSNNQYAWRTYADLGRFYSEQTYKNFSFNIDPRAIIDGIEVQVEGYIDSSIDNAIRITLFGEDGGTSDQKSIAFGTSETTETYGSPSDLWGREWVPDDFTNANFGVNVIGYAGNGSAKQYIDHIQVKVYYTIIEGDIDGDGYVDFFDFAILASQWLQTPGIPSADIAPEIGDGIVNFQDLYVLTDYWLEDAIP